MSNLFIAHEPLDREWIHLVEGERKDAPLNLGKSWDIAKDSQQFTMCAWLNVKEKYSNAGYRILSKRGDSGWEFVAPRYSSGRISFYADGRHVDVGNTDFTDPQNRRADLVSLPEPVDPDWHHVLVTYYEGTMRAYLDGEFDGEALMGVDQDNSENEDLWMGSCARSWGERAFKEHVFAGEMRNLQVFQNALTQRQIKELANPAFITWMRKFWKLQCSVSPSKWCVNLGQLNELAEQVKNEQRKWEGKLREEGKPNMYEVVDKWIKPQTRQHGISWALMRNFKGLRVKWFVSHAWKEKFKDFVNAVKDFTELQKDDGVWTCFLANPQTWPRLLLSELLGAQAFHSPFAVAMEAAQAQLVVRTDISTEQQEECVYSRLWCVFEAWIAAGMKRDGKPLEMVALGKTYTTEECANMSPTIGVSGASCSSAIDRENIMICIQKDPRDVDDIMRSVLTVDSGCVAVAATPSVAGSAGAAIRACRVTDAKP